MINPIYIAVGRVSMAARPYLRAYPTEAAWRADLTTSAKIEAYPYARADELLARLPEVDWLTADEVDAIREQYRQLTSLYQS